MFRYYIIPEIMTYVVINDFHMEVFFLSQKWGKPQVNHMKVFNLDSISEIQSSSWIYHERFRNGSKSYSDDNTHELTKQINTGIPEKEKCKHVN